MADFLHTSAGKYDIISADEKTTGKYATNSFSYSKEYYALLRKHLAPGGLVIQWIPADLPPSQFTLAIRTFVGSFPHVLCWYFPPVGSFTMTNTFLVGSNQPVNIDPGWMRQAMESDPGAFQGIRKYGLDTPEAVLAHFVGNEQTLRRGIPAGPVNSFERPYFEFYSPVDYAVSREERALEDQDLMVSMRGPDFENLVLKGVSGPEAGRLKAAFQAEGIFMSVHQAMLQGQPAGQLQQYYDQALGAAPWDNSLRDEILSDLYSESRKAYFAGDNAGALTLIRRAAWVYPESSEVHKDYGLMLWKTGQMELAEGELERAVSLNPQFVPARRGLAEIYAALGENEKAKEQWKEALAMDPDNVSTLEGYGIYLAQQRSGAKAVQLLGKAYKLDSEDPGIIDGYARAMYMLGDITDAKRIVKKGGDYYKANPLFDQLRAAILGAN